MIKVLIEYKNLAVGTIQDENVEKCVELRDSQAMFFFGDKPEREKSYEWIRQHRENNEDVLYQITHRETGVFLGTIGMVKHGDEIEIGRLAIYAKGVCQLLKNGAKREDVGEIGLYACIMLLRLIVQTQCFHNIYAEVLSTNALSNKLCNEQCGKIERSYRLSSDGEKINTFIYRMTKEEIDNKYRNEKVAVFFT